MKHRLIARQLRSGNLDESRLPEDLRAWQEFLSRVEKAYLDSDQERYLLERSLLISSKEMQERWLAVEQERSRSAHSSKMASLGEMAGGVAHEINSPLAVIAMAAAHAREVLAENGSKKQIDEFLERIEVTTTRIARVVKGMRTFSRDSSSDPMSMTDACALVDETLALCAERFRQHSVDFQYQGLAAALTLECRPTEISQVLLNLLNNAFDAVLPLPEKWIRLTLSGTDNDIEISVTDCGGGIPVVVREKMFQPFFTTKDVGKGTGLGLSLAMRIVSSHCGSLFVDDNSPNTRFVIRLPRRQSNEKDEAA